MKPERDDLIVPDSIHEITSGGEVKPGESIPAMFSTKERALAAYKRCLDEFLATVGIDRWRVVSQPIADKWHITIMDESGLHRVADIRWSVSAKIGITKFENPQDGSG